MAQKFNKIFIVIVFLLAIIFPLVFAVKIGGEVSIAENRYLATFPDILTKDMKLAPGIRVGLENWINDNAGGRDLALQINNTILFKVFHIIPEENVVGGKDNWLYLLPNFDLPQCLHTNLPTQEQLDVLKGNFSNISMDLKREKIEYLVMLLPYKCNIYPENLPGTLVPVNQESALDVLDQSLAGNSTFDFSTELESLYDGKKIRSDYYKAFDPSHWNQYGAFIGYTKIMQQVKKHIPNIKILTDKDFVITPVMKETTTSWGFHTQEEDLQYTLIGGYHGISDKTFFNTFNFISKDPWKSYNYYKNPDNSLPKAVVIGDSFTWMFLLPNMSESFSELVFILYYDMDNLNKIIDIIKPDIVIQTGLAGEVYDFASYTYGHPGNFAQIVSANTPTEITRDKAYNVNIIVKNTGSESWTEDRKIRLCIFVNGTDYGFRVNLPNTIEVKPGEEYTFTLYNLQAPPDNEFYIQYQMVEEGLEYFGEKVRVDITVK